MDHNILVLPGGIDAQQLVVWWLDLCARRLSFEDGLFDHPFRWVVKTRINRCAKIALNWFACLLIVAT